MTKRNKHTKRYQRSMVFQSMNYKLLILGLVLITGGFTAMYLENEVTGVISLFVSPIVIMTGYITIIFAIMIQRSGSSSTEKGGTQQ